MGTHGRSGLAHMLLGSVAEKVVRYASCPVLTIRPDAFSFELPWGKASEEAKTLA
jgi:hypothetical protein